MSAYRTQPPGSPSVDEAAKRAGDDARASWGFPAFARDFPREPALDVLVAAFVAGDYATVRAGAPKLVATTDDAEVKRAAVLLRARIEPDPTARVFFGLTAGLLVFLTVWWVTHDGPEHRTPPPPPPVIEFVK